MSADSTDDIRVWVEDNVALLGRERIAEFLRRGTGVSGEVAKQIVGRMERKRYTRLDMAEDSMYRSLATPSIVLMRGDTNMANLWDTLPSEEGLSNSVMDANLIIFSNFSLISWRNEKNKTIKVG